MPENPRNALDSHHAAGGHAVRGAVGVLIFTALTGCGGGGGGGGGGNTGEQLTDPVIPLVGPTGRYSMTPTEANQNRGVIKPPLMPIAAQNGQNQFLRLEVPFDVRPVDIMSADSIFRPFSQLTGNLSITDELGNHVPGIVLVNGVDAFGVSRTADAGFPHDLTASGADRNVGAGVILYVADDGDGVLSTVAALGGSTLDLDGRADTTDVKQIRIALNELNGRNLSGFWTVTVDDGTTGDTTNPRVLSVIAEEPDPTAPLDPTHCATTTRFIIQYSEPVVPTTSGKSAELDGTPFLGNMPLLPTPPLPPQPPLPTTYLSASLNASSSPLFLPVDVKPLNANNLATYIVTPLIDLPANGAVELVVVDSNANQDPATTQPVGPIDLSGNFHRPGAEVRQGFNVGPGRSPVNAPVSPEVFYWLPIGGRGFGAVDLNGAGFTTNTPGKNANDWRRAAIITKPTVNGNPAANLDSATAIIARPGAGAHNQYAFPVGTGAFIYGPGFSIGGHAWEGLPNENGNTGTPVPGVNEMSSGFETLVRNAAGDVILTGRDFGDVGVVSDLVTGDFLDAGIFDTQSVFAQTSFHISAFWGAGVTRNNIGEPPVPNPPPSRFWIGLQPVDVLIDQNDPLGIARLIEGAEVFSGTQPSYHFVVPNQSDPIGFDSDTPPGIRGFEVGPSPQSATAAKTYSARQQLGNYLYAVDAENKALQVINSNTFQTMATLSLPDPRAVAVMPNNRYVFTANAGDDTMSIIGADPTQPDFHQEIARLKVGRGPGAIACQMDGEDVFVVNTLDNNISIVELASLVVRKTLDTLIDGPRDIVLSPRQGAFGWAAGVYFGYIANFTGNNVVVYESGPDGPQGIGCNNVLGSLPTDGNNENQDIFEPRSMVYSPYANDEGLYAGGVFVAHRNNIGSGIVSHIQFTHQALFGPLPCVLPPGSFFIPPGFNVRIFEIVGQWGTNGGNALIANKPSSMVLSDLRLDQYQLLPSQPPSNDMRGTPGFGGGNSRHPIRFLTPIDPRFPHCPVVEPDRMYISFEDTDRIQIVDPTRVGVTLGEIEGTGIGIKKLVSYYSSQ